jgi:uncharacterized protein YggE
MISKPFIVSLVAVLTSTASSSLCSAQFAGSRGGVTENSLPERLPVLAEDVAGKFIAIEGKAEHRLEPTEIRIVLAVTSEDATSQGCLEKTREPIAQIRKSCRELGIDETAINEDFIAILPRYEWEFQDREKQAVGVELLAGYRMQTNLHLAVPNEDVAMKVLEKAFQAGVTDIIGFDYWSDAIEEGKATARLNAIKAAKEKSEQLLSLFGAEKPEIINVQENTVTHFPSSLYESFENTYSPSVRPPNRRDVPLISAYRPKNTYYRGLNTDPDTGSVELPMKRQISLVSTVRIYYRSPFADLKKKPKE